MPAVRCAAFSPAPSGLVAEPDPSSANPRRRTRRPLRPAAWRARSQPRARAGRWPFDPARVVAGGAIGSGEAALVALPCAEHYVTHQVEKRRVVIDGVCACHGEAQLPTHVRGFVIEVVQHLDVVADEADRADDDRFESLRVLVPQVSQISGPSQGSSGRPLRLWYTRSQSTRPTRSATRVADWRNCNW